MKLSRTVPTPVFIGGMVFILLLFGSYMIGSTHASSAEPVYITDGTGGNPADVVNVNHQGHLSVHIADGSLPSFTGAIGDRHMAYPPRPGLTNGQCYAAFIRGGGSFSSGSVHFNAGTGVGIPQVLVRIDSDPVWVDTGGQGTTPSSPLTGFTRTGNTYVFGFPYTLSFKAFAGIMLCWHSPGQSDSFEVQMTIANNGGNAYDQEELLVQRQGNNFSWFKLQGPKPKAYRVAVSTQTTVSFYHPVTGEVPFIPHVHHYAVSGQPTPLLADPRYYIFEMQYSGDPTRVGPFGDWTGE